MSSDPTIASTEQEAPTTPAKPITLWSIACPFRKTGSPVVGTMGTSIRDVVVMEADEWKRMLRLIPADVLEKTQFNVGSYE
jgi:hypothetical protein